MDGSSANNYQDDQLAALWEIILAHEATPNGIEEDGSLARRLPEEWEIVVADRADETSIETPPVAPLDSTSHSWHDPQMDPKHCINEFKDMFIGDMPCSKCRGSIPSRRGVVGLNNVARLSSIAQATNFPADDIHSNASSSISPFSSPCSLYKLQCQSL